MSELDWVIAAVALGFAFILWPVTLLILATLLGGPLGFLLAVIIIVIVFKKTSTTGDQT